MKTSPIENKLLQLLQEVPIDSNSYLLGVDGYTINFSTKKCTAFLFKREFTSDDEGEVSTSSLIESFLEDLDFDELSMCCSLTNRLGIPMYAVFWPHDYPANNIPVSFAPVWVFEIPSKKLVLNGYGLDLCKFLRNLRGISFNRVKPLNSARTLMECRMSNTRDPWPGDLDCAVINRNTDEVEALLEFKTHNLVSSVRLESMNRYREQDLRRFEVLSHLRTQIGQTQEKLPSLLFVAWGPGHSEIKVQKVSGSYEEEVLLQYPRDKDEASEFFSNLRHYF